MDNDISNIIIITIHCQFKIMILLQQQVIILPLLLIIHVKHCSVHTHWEGINILVKSKRSGLQTDFITNVCV